MLLDVFMESVVYQIGDSTLLPKRLLEIPLVYTGATIRKQTKNIAPAEGSLFHRLCYFRFFLFKKIHQT